MKGDWKNDKLHARNFKKPQLCDRRGGNDMAWRKPEKRLYHECCQENARTHEQFVGMAKSVQEGDVFSVIHNDGQIVRVIEKDIEATKKMAALKKKVVVA